MSKKKKKVELEELVFEPGPQWKLLGLILLSRSDWSIGESVSEADCDCHRGTYSVNVTIEMGPRVHVLAKKFFATEKKALKGAAEFTERVTKKFFEACDVKYKKAGTYSCATNEEAQEEHRKRMGNVDRGLH